MCIRDSSGSTIGVGLAVIRLASVAGLPLAGLADRLGRRRTMLACCAGGLVLTAAASISPSYWWFVGIFAVGRPMLSATNALSQVSAGELTASSNRAKAVSLVAAGYAVGAGLTAIIYNLGRHTLGFRGVFALALVLLVLLPIVGRSVAELSLIHIWNTEVRPERGGHSISKVLLASSSTSKSPSAAHARTRLPPDWTTSPRSTQSSSGAGRPSSSANSRAAVARSSPSSTSPFGTDHTPSSRRAQNGPPGWTSSTSMPSPPRRKRRRPALGFGTRPDCHSSGPGDRNGRR